MPQSMTSAPGWTISPVTRPGTPAATRTTSARRTSAGKVARPAVADGDGGVLAHQQQVGGLADHVASGRSPPRAGPPGS